ncbi:MAG: Nif3-like dinuclear metal center hexameric protein [Bacteroidetes bacterium]|nr:MAG: Nif3-like dinuclear metal center hexameric protein [Bacteroidota bacterium]
MKLKEILNVFEEQAPFSLQESYDNSGIQYGNPEQEVKRGLVCIDITEPIVEEAISKGCDLIISHHPLIFKGLKSLDGSHYTQRALIKAIKNDICLVSVHTNLDSVLAGVNQKLALKIGLEDLKILDTRRGLLKKLVVFCPTDQAEMVRNAIFAAGAGQIGEYDCCSFNLEGTGSFKGGDNTNPFVGAKGEVHFEKEVRIETILPGYLQGKVLKAMIDAHPYEEVAYDLYPLDNTFDKTGMGMVGQLPQPMEEAAFLAMLGDELGCPAIRHSPFVGKSISKVAVCGGSGSFLRDKAMAAGADAFVTADVKYHDFFDVEGVMLLADVGHYESEQFTKEILYEIVTEKFTNFALLISDQSSNPVRYFK